MPPQGQDIRRYRYWLGQVCKDARLQRGASIEQLADFISNRETIRLFEAGARLTKDSDEWEDLVALYAALNDEDARALHARAVRRWKASGEDGKPIPPEPKVRPLLIGRPMPRPGEDDHRA